VNVAWEALGSGSLLHVLVLSRCDTEFGRRFCR
jgi:hypothetical protein